MKKKADPILHSDLLYTILLCTPFSVWCNARLVSCRWNRVSKRPPLTDSIVWRYNIMEAPSWVVWIDCELNSRMVRELRHSSISGIRCRALCTPVELISCRHIKYMELQSMAPNIVCPRQLSRLQLRMEHLYRINNIESMEKLRHLDLSHCQITDVLLHDLYLLAARGQMHLKSLNLSNTETGDVLVSYLPAFTSLTSLNLANTLVTNDLVPVLANLPRLKQLNLSRTNVNWIAPFIARFSDGETLQLLMDDCRIDPRILNRLHNYKNN